mgnify:FL=1
MNPQSDIQEIDKLTQQVNAAQLPQELKDKALQQIERILLTLKFGGSLTQLDIAQKYIDWITHLPWSTSTQENLNVNEVKKVLDAHHFGLEKIKTRVLEYISILILQKQSPAPQAYHAPILFFVGLAGTGKTTFASSLAEALGRSFVRIPFGGLSSALDLRGQSKTMPNAEPGLVMKILRQAQSNNPVILLDELDRISPDAQASIMGVLLELLDPNQNKTFTDHFIDFPFDLSRALFIATANNTNSISTAVLDRLEVVQMPSYTDMEKIAIAKQYVLPKTLNNAGMNPNEIVIDDLLWQKITRPLGFDSGIRTLERTIETIVRKVAFKMAQGQKGPYRLNEANIKEFLG